MLFTVVVFICLGCSTDAIYSSQDIRPSNNIFKNFEIPPSTRSTTGTLLYAQALVEGTAFLPCDLTPSQANDSVVLVVWYKNEHIPIYSYDVRGQDKSKHWKSSEFERRSRYEVYQKFHSTLSIDNITEADEDEYRCRIDYLKSPTKNQRVRLNVIVPPTTPIIYDDKQNRLLHKAGPYEEGDDVVLICLVRNGKPKPTIKWFQEGKLLEAKTNYNEIGKILTSRINIIYLERTFQNATFTCQTSNNNISTPLSASVYLEMHFRPLITEIISHNQVFSVERKYDIICHTYGSHPPAEIVWILNGHQLNSRSYNIVTTYSPDGNSTNSTLTFIPKQENNDENLICRAINTRMKKGLQETILQLTIYYIANVHLDFGDKINPDDIEEGDDVYFDCKIDANPKAYKVVWKHDNVILHPNLKEGIIISSNTLVLQKVKQKQTGSYSCVASNVEGDGESNVVSLDIKYLPSCITSPIIIGVGRHENVNITCEVKSNPPPDKYLWTVNNTSENNEIPQKRYNTGETAFHSVMTYTPITDLDFGTIMCAAVNMVGKQVKPCIFHVITAGKPDPVQNCSIANRTNVSLQIECTEGFDGGQPQYFILEVYDRKTKAIEANVSMKEPTFIVSGLDPGAELNMEIFAANSKGRSEPTVLEGFTLKMAEKHIGDQIEIVPMLGILVGLVTALLLISVIILGVFKIHQSTENGSRAKRSRFPTAKDKIALPLRSESEDLFEKDDKNPDVVPSNKDSDYQLESADQTPALNNSVISVAGNEIEPTVSSPSPISSASSTMLNITPLAEAYMARNRCYIAPNVTNNEVVYAELQLARPCSLDPIKNGGQQVNPVEQYATLRKRDDSTIYTKIDHNRRPPPPIPNSRTSPIISPVAAIFPTYKPGINNHREVVTVRTPLMGCHQESCV